jgi:hypothetical protein
MFLFFSIIRKDSPHGHRATVRRGFFFIRNEPIPDIYVCVQYYECLYSLERHQRRPERRLSVQLPLQLQPELLSLPTARSGDGCFHAFGSPWNTST